MQFDAPAAALILAITAATSLLGLYRMPRLIDRLIMRPHLVARGRQLETVFTSGLVHGDVGHLLFNMFTFWFFAFPMERHLGTERFVLLYVAGLAASSLCSVVRHRNNLQYATLGASGAISAVLFAYIVYFPLSTLIILPFPVPIPAVLFAVGYVAWSFWAARQESGRINHDAHLCGALFGVLFIFLTDPRAILTLLQRL